jgi:hypothetical protein
MLPEAQIHAAIQALLDSLGDGWALAQHVIIMGIERVIDGEIEATSWYWCPASQPEWMTDGLMDHGMRLREEDLTGD